VSPFAEYDAIGNVDASFPQLIDLLKQNVRVDNDAVSDEVESLGPEDPAWNQMKTERSLVVDHGVSGVVATSEARDNVGVSRQKINDLPFALITPLSA
jgi:hypothetical protein